jgi:predicted MFS family arabinose efflux permease
MSKSLEIRKSEIGVFTVIRIIFDAGVRMVYPFLPAISRGLQIDLATITLAISFSLATNALGPFIAPVADRYGRRIGLLIGLSIFTIGCALAGFFPGYWTFLVGLLLINLGDNIFLPSMQSYISDRVSYEKRGAYIGVTEFAWSLSFILVIPLIGLLIQATWWNIPFDVLGGLGLLAIFIILIRFPGDRPHPEEAPKLYAGLAKIFQVRNAWLIMIAGILAVTANGLVNVLFGVWMEDSFRLQITALGLASMIIGFSELGGETLTTLLSDRLGKERSLILGLAVNTLAVLSLPLLGNTVFGALVWLSLFAISFEFGIASSWMIVSEVLPVARATMIAVYIAALSLGFALGSILAPHFYVVGMFANAVAAAGFNLLAILLVTRIRLPKPALSD